MNDKGKDLKKEAGKLVETIKNKYGDKWKIIVGVLVVVIIFLNTFWNMTESKISETVTDAIGSLDSNLAGFDSRLAEIEKGTVDLEAIKTDITSIQKAKEDFDKKLLAVVEAEELKMAALEEDLANQKAYVEKLKGLLE